MQQHLACALPYGIRPRCRDDDSAFDLGCASICIHTQAAEAVSAVAEEAGSASDGDSAGTHHDTAVTDDAAQGDDIKDDMLVDDPAATATADNFLPGSDRLVGDGEFV